MADFFIGLMSGTSMDGIDAALVDFTATCPDIISTHSHKYPAALHRQLEAALELEAPLNTDLTAIDVAVGESFAAATNELLSKAVRPSSSLIRSPATLSSRAACFCNSSLVS